MGEHDLGPSWPGDAMGSRSEELDLDAWVDGTCGLTITAKIFRDGDTLSQIDQLNRELEVVKKIPKEHRGINDQTPELIERQIEELSEKAMASVLVVHIQDRTEERRETIRERVLKDIGANPKDTTHEQRETVAIHVLADAIVKAESGGKTKALPEGFPPNQLRAIRDSLGDSGLIDCWNAFTKVTTEAPRVAAPLSQRNSSKHGGIT